jgi:Glycine rich protein
MGRVRRAGRGGAGRFVGRPPRWGGNAAATCVLLGVGALVMPVATAQAGTARFTYTGAEQTFTVPQGDFFVGVRATGGSGGGTGRGELGALGGAPAEVEGNIRVVPGETLYVEVGGKGESEVGGGLGGFNGGGMGGPARVGAGGGGGASDVRTLSRTNGASSLSSRRIVAAGGGGAGGWQSSVNFHERGCEGAAGGAAGAPGEGKRENPTCEPLAITGGQPGTQSSGGAGGAEWYCGAGEAGSLGSGGAGSGAGLNGGPNCQDAVGGGGGGGLYGGGGGAGTAESSGAGGGGGSSLVPFGGTEALAPLAAEPMVEIFYEEPCRVRDRGHRTERRGRHHRCDRTWRW